MTKAAGTKYAVETIREPRRLAAEAQKLGDKKLLASYENQIQKILMGWG